MKSELQTAALQRYESAFQSFKAAMVARDSIEQCTSPEWTAAHQIAKAASILMTEARLACYACGAIVKPYWA